MVNILVPTDFSALSKVATAYAIKIANRLGGNVTLLHVVKAPSPVNVSVPDTIKRLQDDMVKHAEADLDKLVNTFGNDLTTIDPIKWRVGMGTDFNAAVLQEARQLRTGLIVMGTRGASGLKKAVIGSNTASMIETSHIPVLAVPKNARFYGFRDIVYATDLKNLAHELRILVRYAKQFDSTIHIIHVTPSGDSVEAIEGKINDTAQKINYEKNVTLVLVDANIEGAIDQYIGLSNADVLTMFTHDLTFFEKLFNRSHTRRMAFQSRVPLLVFRKRLNSPES